MIYDSALGFMCYIHELRKKYGREFLEYISAHCLLCSNQLFDFFLLDKSSMVNDVPENDNSCLNPVSSWRCGLWSPLSSPYSLIHCKSLDKVIISDPRNLVDRPRYMAIFVCRSGSRCSVWCWSPISHYCVCNVVVVALLLVKYMRIASVIGYGVLFSGSVIQLL
jgi:hypothetical protein